MSGPLVSTLNSGVRTLLLPRPDSLSVHILLAVGVGANYESTAENGSAHFLEHLAFKGTARWPTTLALASALDELGADYNAYTSREETVYYASCLPDRLPAVLAIMADLYVAPRLAAEDVEKERRVILEEIKRQQDQPQRQVADLWAKAFYGDTAFGRSVLGSPDTIHTLSRDTLLDFRRRHYHTANTLLVVAGRFEPETVRALLEQHTISWPTGTISPKLAAGSLSPHPLLTLQERTLEQTHLWIGFPSFGMADERRLAATVAADILGGGMSSRLFQLVREELGLAYTIGANNCFFDRYGDFFVSTAVHSARAVEALKIILTACRRLGNEAPLDSEVARSVTALLGNTYLSLETPAAQASWYASQALADVPLLTPTDYGDRLQRLTPALIQQTAAEMFSAATLAVAIVGPHADQAPFEEVLTVC